MKEDILFSERQFFKQKALWVILIFIDFIFIYGSYSQIFKGVKFGQHLMSNIQIVFCASLLIIITLFFSVAHLDTIIKKDGIYIKFFPFHLNFIKYPFVNINELNVSKYNPIKQYGGWGLRFTLRGDKAFNISGNYGVKIMFKNGKNLLIGTNEPQLIKIKISLCH